MIELRPGEGEDEWTFSERAAAALLAAGPIVHGPCPYCGQDFKAAFADKWREWLRLHRDLHRLERFHGAPGQIMVPDRRLRLVGGRHGGKTDGGGQAENPAGEVRDPGKGPGPRLLSH
jgi:hypothetical protein